MHNLTLLNISLSLFFFAACPAFSLSILGEPNHNAASRLLSAGSDSDIYATSLPSKTPPLSNAVLIKRGNAVVGSSYYTMRALRSATYVGARAVL